MTGYLSPDRDRDDRIKKNYLRQATNYSLHDKLISIEEVETFNSYRTQVRNIAD
jgi:hypothetical protein